MRRRGSRLRIAGTSPNIFIGGVSATITDETTLAAKLNTTAKPVSANDISYFAIIGVNIEARINVDYIIPYKVFENNSAITYFKESAEGRCIDTGHTSFRNTPNLTEVEFYGNCLINLASFVESAGIKKAIFHNADTMYYYANFRYTTMDLFFAPKLKFRFGDAAIQTQQVFGNIKNIYIPLVEQLGKTQLNESHFLSCPQGVKIWANPALQTSNGGAEEGDLAYARASKAAIINYSQPVLTPNDFGV